MGTRESPGPLQCSDLQSIFSEDALKLKCPKCALKINFRAPQQLWRYLRDHFLPLNWKWHNFWPFYSQKLIFWHRKIRKSAFFIGKLRVAGSKFGFLFACGGHLGGCRQFQVGTSELQDLLWRYLQRLHSSLLWRSKHWKRPGRGDCRGAHCSKLA